jgi:hypothetical protein
MSAEPSRASEVSRHVQVTGCAGATYVCMSLTYPRYGGGAKALCIGFRREWFERTYGKLPALTERGVSLDDSCVDVEWDTLMRLDAESRSRG